MHRRIRTSLVSVGVAAGTVIASVFAAVPASAAATTTYGLWYLNEAPGANTARDSSGHGHHGKVGADIQTGVVVSGATAYRFPTWDSTAARHEVVVPESDQLDPGRSDFRLSTRFRTARYYSNVVQKGQAGTTGGYWKLEIARGIAKCQFRTDTGTHLTVSSGSRRVDDARWHSIACYRDGATAWLVVDGVETSRRTGLSGTVNNTWELAMGGKSRCDQVDVGCDFFAGEIDYVRIMKG
jgi:hypothetical protein